MLVSSRAGLRGAIFLGKNIRGVKVSGKQIRGTEILVYFLKKTPTGYPELKITMPGTKMFLRLQRVALDVY